MLTPTLGIPDRQGVRSQRLLSLNDLEGALVELRAPLQVVEALGNVQQLNLIPLVGTHIVPKILLNERIYSFSLVIHLGVEAYGEV